MLQKKVDQWRRELKEELIEEGVADFKSGDYHVLLQLRRSRPQPDDVALEQLLINKGLFDICSKQVVDHDLVEQAYIEGMLTDDEMRSVCAETRVIPALKIEKME